MTSGYTLFAIKDIKDIQRKKHLFGNDNLWPLDIYNGPSQVYCFKPEGKIHKCIKGLKCQWLLIWVCCQDQLCRVNHSPKWGWALKWANGRYPIQIHANFQILMGHLIFLWVLCKIWWAQESLISTLEHNWHEIWIACIWGPDKNKVHFSKTLIAFSQNGSGPSSDEPWFVVFDTVYKIAWHWR